MAIFTKVPRSAAPRPAAGPRPYPLRTPEAVMAQLGEETPEEARTRREDKPPPPAGERLPLGQWLIENMPRGTNLEIDASRKSNRKIPFIDDEEGEV